MGPMDTGRVPRLGMRAGRRPRRVDPSASRLDLESARRVATEAGWWGETLPLVEVLGVLVYPVIEQTGAARRIEVGPGPVSSMDSLELWEVIESGGLGTAPPSPVRIVGFVASALTWRSAVTQLGAVEGLGAGLVVRGYGATRLQRLEADAAELWMVEGGRTAAPTLTVRGRSGPVPTSRRIAATRLMEEGLFAHALACGALGR